MTRVNIARRRARIGIVAFVVLAAASLAVAYYGPLWVGCALAAASCLAFVYALLHGHELVDAQLAESDQGECDE